MIRKISGAASLLLGLGVMGLWAVLLAAGRVPELRSEPVAISLHIFSEYLMAATLLFAGYGLLADRPWAKKAFLLGLGMMIYAALNAAGYYGQRGNLPALAAFLCIAAAGAVTAGIFIRSS